MFFTYSYKLHKLFMSGILVASQPLCWDQSWRVLPVHWPLISDVNAALVSVPLSICAGFVHFHCTGRWVVLGNTRGKDSDAFRIHLLNWGKSWLDSAKNSNVAAQKTWSLTGGSTDNLWKKYLAVVCSWYEVLVLSLLVRLRARVASPWNLKDDLIF